MKLCILEERNAPDNEIVICINDKVYRYFDVPSRLRMTLRRYVSFGNRGVTMRLLRGYKVEEETDRWKPPEGSTLKEIAFRNGYKSGKQLGPLGLIKRIEEREAE